MKKLLPVSVAAACLSMALGCGPDPRKTIAAVDRAYYRISDGFMKEYNKIPDADRRAKGAAVTRYTKNLYAIDTSQCPEDFRMAFTRVIQAEARGWDEYAATGGEEGLGKANERIDEYNVICAKYNYKR